jgi:hypothetical protein
MATLTAMILVGRGHPNHDGINPTHYLFLSENDRPAWILLPENVFNKGTDAMKKKVTWIPTVENMLEDALLMVAIHVLKDKEITELAGNYFKNKRPNWVELGQDINKQDLSKLYKKCRDIDNRYKIVLTVLESSTIQGQLKVLENYKMDIEVCTPRYSRLYSEWTKETRIVGSLE